MQKTFITFIYCLLLMCDQRVVAQTIDISTEHWPPYNYQHSTGNIVGLATDKVRKILDISGYKYSISIFPWARAYHRTRKKANMALYSIMRTPARESEFQWVCPLVKASAVYFYRLSSRPDIKVDKVEDLKKYMIGVSRNEYDHLYLLEHGFKEQIDFDIAFQDQIKLDKLLKGRVDLMAATDITINTDLKQKGKDRSTITKAFVIDNSNKNNICMAFSLKTPTHIVAKIRDALKKVNQQTP